MKGYQTAFANNWQSTLTAAIGAADTTINVGSSDAIALSNQVSEWLGSTAFLRPVQLTLGPSGGPYETVLATLISGFNGDITIVRADQETPAQAWPAGTVVGAYATRDALNALADGYRPMFQNVIDMSGGSITVQMENHLGGQQFDVNGAINGDPPPGSILTIQAPADPTQYGVAGWFWRGFVEVNNESGQSIDLQFENMSLGAGVVTTVPAFTNALAEIIFWPTIGWMVRAV